MKIVYVITTSNWGGAQKYVYDLVNDRLSKKDDVWLIVGNEGELSKRADQLHAKVIIVPELVRNISFYKDIISILKIRKILKNINPDIIHLNSSKAGTIGRLAATSLKARVIFTVHGWPFTEGISAKKQFLYSFIEKNLVSFADKIICVSKYDYNLALERKVVKDPSKMIVIHNGIKDSLSKNGFVKENNNEKLTLTMVARFDEPKNQSLLLKALSNANFNFKLNLVGTGSKLAEVKAQAKKLFKDSGREIVFWGFQRNVDAILEETDVFVLISKHEALPLSIIEAMKHGLPIVASNVGGIKELVTTNCYLVDDGKAIVETVTELNQNRDQIRILGQNSRKIYLSEYTQEKMLYETNRVYQDDKRS